MSLLLVLLPHFSGLAGSFGPDQLLKLWVELCAVKQRLKEGRVPAWVVQAANMLEGLHFKEVHNAVSLGNGEEILLWV
jgi:hypothetical protein